MLSSYFYHKTIRRTIAVFGTLFNNIYIRNEDSNKADETIKTSRVPLAYGPKRAFLERINNEKDLETNQRVAIQLPRMSFEITSFSYDTETATSMINKVSHRFNNGSDLPTQRSVTRTRTPVPYKIGLQLNIMANYQDEALQILEQILPYFRPDFSVTVRHFDGAESVWDMPITLNSVSMDNQYEGSFEDRQVIVHSLDFEVLVRFFGPVQEQGIITKVTANVRDIDEPDHYYTSIELEAVPSSPGNEDGYIITTSFEDDFFLLNDG